MIKQKGYKTPSWIYMQFKGVWEKVPANRIARRIYEREERIKQKQEKK